MFFSSTVYNFTIVLEYSLLAYCAGLMNVESTWSQPVLSRSSRRWAYFTLLKCLWTLLTSVYCDVTTHVTSKRWMLAVGSLLLSSGTTHRRYPPPQPPFTTAMWSFVVTCAFWAAEPPFMSSSFLPSNCRMHGSRVCPRLAPASPPAFSMHIISNFSLFFPLNNRYHTPGPPPTMSV